MENRPMVELPEGFVEFAMQMMVRAKELRAAGVTQETARKRLDMRPASDDNADQFAIFNAAVQKAALACLAVVEPVTVEGEAK